MIDLKQSIIKSLDGAERELLQFIPYLLQDLWEIGSSPEPFIQLIKSYGDNYTEMKILDLGCGKGFVTISIAKEFKCHCHGIDAMPEFICEAEERANEHSVSDICSFEVNDIRSRIKSLKDFDFIILGSIGDVFGNYESTLCKLSNSIKKSGAVIIDDGYKLSEDNKSNSKNDILGQISKAGMKLEKEIIYDANRIKESNDFIFSKIVQRSNELIIKYPNKKNLFINYLKKQEEENNLLENRMVCSTMLIKKK